jgi:uncharacterized protein (TIGR00266 family)
MDFEIACSPTYSLVEIDLDEGETVVGESGAMAWMTPNLRVETSTRGGLMAGLKRSVLGGESIFQNTYTAEGGSGRVAFVPGSSGDIVPHDMQGDLVLERGAYLASSPTVTLDSRWQGLKGMFSEGLFTLHVAGSGMLFFGAYGAVYEVDVDGEYTVDSGFAVAWEPSLQYRVTRARRVRSFLFSDQLLIRFSGRGRLWVQSRSPQAFANWLQPFRPVKQKDDN